MWNPMQDVLRWRRCGNVVWKGGRDDEMMELVVIESLEFCRFSHARDGGPCSTLRFSPPHQHKFKMSELTGSIMERNSAATFKNLAARVHWCLIGASQKGLDGIAAVNQPPSKKPSEVDDLHRSKLRVRYQLIQVLFSTRNYFITFLADATHTVGEVKVRDRRQPTEIWRILIVSTHTHDCSHMTIPAKIRDGRMIVVASQHFTTQWSFARKETRVWDLWRLAVGQPGPWEYSPSVQGKKRVRDNTSQLSILKS
ncbi:uncharacterized protein MYCFIDRAFT_176604 [Pseudocercospora fijiensis CIRAD86]|uniref:Uncharacterized protein n=1 Tax=Pseudocercospora fijiensis (strain CIRAD86) TaxID=383855 RepID=M2ZQH0_PSEFD|nr:uncharacterized protein MYCFIDRAFT_176604 [Pseudocercospora fijiensis CIRAD86]EME81314.1 hypothetical protein MYCFIDRAFT_176604 [Pseudocercospora fijiensis CIRAD86]